MNTKLLLFSIGLLLMPVPFNQFENSEVRGTVRDLSDKSISKATVTLKSSQTGLVLQTETDENGRYDFPSVQAGSYILRVQHSEFTEFTIQLRVAIDIQTVQIFSTDSGQSPQCSDGCYGSISGEFTGVHSDDCLRLISSSGLASSISFYVIPHLNSNAW